MEEEAEVTAVEEEAVTASRKDMEIKQFIKKQIKKHILYTFLPLILFAESVAMSRIYNIRQVYITYTGIITGIYLIAIILLQGYLICRFKSQLKEFNINAEDKYKCLYIGDAVINRQFIINYGYFKKRVYSTDNIVKIYVKNEYVSGRAGAVRTSFTIKRIAILREGQKQIILRVGLSKDDNISDLATSTMNELIKKGEADSLDNINRLTYCSFPFYGYFIPALYGIILVAAEIRHNLINVFVKDNDVVGKVLFHIGYDRILMISAIVIIVIFIMVNYYFKYKYMGINKDSVLTNFLIPGILIAGFFSYITVQQFDYGNISKAARKDFCDYCHNNYECMETWLDSGNYYFYENKNESLYKLALKFDISIQKYYIDSEKKEYLIEFKDHDNDREKGKYKIYYLKHTRLIIKSNKS